MAVNQTRNRGRSGQATDESRSYKATDKETKFSPLMAKLMWEAISNAPTMRGALERARILHTRAYEWVHEYEDYTTFKFDWWVLRNSLPLQARLLVEQVLNERGEPWSRLVSGFKPLEK